MSSEKKIEGGYLVMVAMIIAMAAIVIAGKASPLWIIVPFVWWFIL